MTNRASSLMVGTLVVGTFLVSPACEEDDDPDGIDVARPDGGVGGMAGAPGVGGMAGAPGVGGMGGVSGAGGMVGTVDAGTFDAAALGVTTESEVLGVLVDANAGEVTVGGLALTRSRSQAVVDFADTMVTVHTAAGVRVSALALRLGLLLADSPGRTLLRMQASDTHDALMAIGEVPAFERAYLESQVTMHATVLQVIDQLAAIAQNTELRSELETMRTDARAHLAHARALLSQ